MYDRILVPLDGSPCSEAALPHAHALAEKFGAELILLRVVSPILAPPPPPSDMGLWVPGSLYSAESEAAREQDAESYIASIARSFTERGGVVTEVEWGGAAEQIAQCAVQHRVDLIVMGTHGRHGLERWLVGSTTDDVLHTTEAPILLVKYH